MNNIFLKNLLQVLASNFFVLLIGIVTTIFMPTLLSPSEFGWYQLYIFYSSFVGFLLFGFCDGIYLIYGGKMYEELDKSKFSLFYNTLIIYLLLISLIVVTISKFFVMNSDYKFIWISVGLTIFFQGANSFFILVNQAVSRFKIYAIMNMVEKIILVVYLISMVILNREVNYKPLIAITIISKICSLIMNIAFDYKLVFTKFKFNSTIFEDIKTNIAAGLPLTLSGVISMAIPGVGKQMVQSKLGTEQFGYFSLNFSILGIITQVISAFSVVFYPMLRNKPDEILKKNILSIEKIIDYMAVLINFLYYPICIFITLILPKYIATLDSIIFMLPILVFQAKNSILYINILKAKRKEKAIMFIGMSSLIFSYIITKISFNIVPNITSVAFGTMLSYFIWNIISRAYIGKLLNLKHPDMSISLTSIIFFIGLNFSLGLEISFIYYSIFSTVVFILKRKEIRYFINKFKEESKK